MAENPWKSLTLHPWERGRRVSVQSLHLCHGGGFYKKGFNSFLKKCNIGNTCVHMSRFFSDVFSIVSIAFVFFFLKYIHFGILVRKFGSWLENWPPPLCRPMLCDTVASHHIWLLNTGSVAHPDCDVF